MNYQYIYRQLISSCTLQTFDANQYFEVHHIVPRSLGGSNDETNLVKLTARQHYIAHMILLKIAEQTNDQIQVKKMLYAFHCMKYGRAYGRRSFKFNSRLYEKLKIKYAKLRTSMMFQKNPMHKKIWICNFYLKQSKIWDENLPLPEGWIKGRHLKKGFDELEKKNIQKLETEKQRQKDKEEKMKLLRDMFEEFKLNGFEGVVSKFDYKFTRNNLIMNFKTNISEYVPQVCNRWKNRSI